LAARVKCRGGIIAYGTPPPPRPGTRRWLNFDCECCRPSNLWCRRGDAGDPRAMRPKKKGGWTLLMREPRRLLPRRKVLRGRRRFGSAGMVKKKLREVEVLLAGGSHRETSEADGGRLRGPGGLQPDAARFFEGRPGGRYSWPRSEVARKKREKHSHIRERNGV